VAKSAVTELTDQIEAIRLEAYNEGYAAAMRAVVEFSTSATAKRKATRASATSANPADATTSPPQRKRVPRAVIDRAGKKRVLAKPVVRHTRRGDNARYIAEAIMALPGHTGPAAAIKKALAAKGHEIPYTSIRHGLGQLQARGEVSMAEDGRTWSYSAPPHQVTGRCRDDPALSERRSRSSLPQRAIGR
jgi:hypothetical protein